MARPEVRVEGKAPKIAGARVTVPWVAIIEEGVLPMERMKGEAHQSEEVDRQGL